MFQKKTQVKARRNQKHTKSWWRNNSYLNSQPSSSHDDFLHIFFVYSWILHVTRWLQILFVQLFCFNLQSGTIPRYSLGRIYSLILQVPMFFTIFKTNLTWMKCAQILSFFEFSRGKKEQGNLSFCRLGHSGKEKVLFVFLNFEPNLFFLPEPQNRPSSLLRLTKPFT